MQIKGFIENSLNEWDGWIASVLFLPGCNLRCRYCHASHLVLGHKKLETIPLEQVLAYLQRQQGWVDGVVISGGEPTLHGAELLELIEQIRELSLQVVVETNGTEPDWVGRLIDGSHMDGIAMDIKAPLTPEGYQRVTGRPVPGDIIRESIRTILQSSLPHEFRITVVPGLVGREELSRIAPHLEDAGRVAIQNFKPGLCMDEALREVLPFAAEEMDEFRDIFSPLVGQCLLRGRDRAAATRGAA